MTDVLQPEDKVIRRPFSILHHVLHRWDNSWEIEILRYIGIGSLDLNLAKASWPNLADLALTTPRESLQWDSESFYHQCLHGS